MPEAAEEIERFQGIAHHDRHLGQGEHGKSIQRADMVGSDHAPVGVLSDLIQRQIEFDPDAQKQNLDPIEAPVDAVWQGKGCAIQACDQ